LQHFLASVIFCYLYGDYFELYTPSKGLAIIPPYDGPAMIKTVNVEIGNDPEYQLYNLKEDLGQQNNLAKSHPEKLELK